MEQNDEKIIERANFVIRVSSIFGIQYENGQTHFRLKNGGYIHKLQMSREEFNDIKKEYRAKLT